MGLFSCMLLAHVFMGILAVSDVMAADNGEPMPAVFGWIFLVMGSCALAGGWALAGLLLASAACMRRLKRRTFCLVVAGISCVIVPLGTVLGVFTIMVLTRPEVISMFNGNAAKGRQFTFAPSQAPLDSG